jgi:PAS domain S-box-containing protein
MREQDYQKPKKSWTIISIFTLLLALILILGSSLIRNQEKRLLNNKKDELTSIAGLKVDQIVQWREERKTDVLVIQENLAVIQLVKDFLSKKDNKREKEALNKWFISLTNHYDYKSIALLNNQGFTVLSLEWPDTIAHTSVEKNHHIAFDKEIIFKDIKKTATINYLHIDLITPLIRTSEGKSETIGALIFRINPKTFLFPLMRIDPDKTKTSETILVENSGDSIIYLSELRFPKNTTFKDKSQSINAGIQQDLLNKDFEGIIETNDYRGIPVIAAIKNVPGTKWRVIAKIDKAEILTSSVNEIFLSKIILSLFVISSVLFGIFIIWAQRVRFYRRMYKAEADKQAIIKHFEYVLKYANDIILLMDYDLNIIEVNDKAYETYGYNRSELIGMKVYDLRAPSAINSFFETQKFLQENSSFTYETVHRKKDGSEFPIEMSARVVEIEGTKYYHAIGRDLSERKQAEKEIRENNKKMSTIVNNLKGVIFNCEKEEDRWVLKYVNGPIKELTGFGTEHFIDRNLNTFTSLIPAEDYSRTKVEIARMLKLGHEYSVEYRLTGSDGNTKWVLERGGGVLKDNEVVSFEGFIIDVTKRKRIEEELIKAKEKAEESDKLKTAFLHNISHEIRTPMNAIVGFTTLLDTPDLSEDLKRQYMDIIFQGSNQLLSIITDIIDVSNIEIGQIKLSTGVVNLNVIVKNLYDHFSSIAEHQKTTLNFHTGLNDSSATIIADGTKLIQVISNLLNNALKFTHKGSVEFGYTKTNNEIEFYVKDTGIGIKSELFEKVFERFYQVENPRTKQYSGTGLGLSICKAYVELMGGKIWLTSTPDNGSVFYFSIPYNIPSQRPEASNSIIGTKLDKVAGKTILVAEDDKINFMLVREILARTGIKILWAINGEEAVEACQSNDNIDLILMDIKMPLMDGFEAMKIIKEIRPSIPVIALTAYADDTDREKILSEGFVAHVSKPIDRTDLYTALQKYL